MVRSVPLRKVWLPNWLVERVNAYIAVKRAIEPINEAIKTYQECLGSDFPKTASEEWIYRTAIDLLKAARNYILYKAKKDRILKPEDLKELKKEVIE